MQHIVYKTYKFELNIYLIITYLSTLKLSELLYINMIEYQNDEIQFDICLNHIRIYSFLYEYEMNNGPSDKYKLKQSASKHAQCIYMSFQDSNIFTNFKICNKLYIYLY